MFKLRNYQEECHNDTMDYLMSPQGTKPGLVVLPTGLGKSINLAKLAEDYEEKIVIICPSQEILDQNYKKFIAFGGKASIYSASFNSKEMGHVTYATLGSIKNLGKQFKDHGVTLLAIDEAHLNTDPSGGMFKTFKEALGPKHVLGYTATPFRLKAYTDPTGYSYSQLTMMNRARPKFFSNIVHATQIPFAVENGFWAPIECYNEEFNPVGLVLNSTGSEYTDSSIRSAVDSNQINNKIYKTTKKLISGGVPSILLFLDSVESCYIMANALGDSAAVVEAKTNKKSRTQIINDFKAGKISVICCVSTLTTGFDFPELQVVMMGRPTNSLAVFYQIYGRLVRPFEGKVGHFYDFGGNIDKFGRMEELVIEDYKGYGWGVFAKDLLITGKPMGGDPIYKKDLDNMKKKSSSSTATKPFFEFGKFKGQTNLDKVPIHYINWALLNAKENMSPLLIEECKKIISTN